MDIAGLRAEIDKYSSLLDIIPDPKKKASPAEKQGNKRRRTETGSVAIVTTPAASGKKGRGAKKAAASSKKATSYYKTIKGVKYDRALLEKADECTEGDGSISEEVAEALVEDAADGQGTTETEKRTLQYVLDNYDCTAAAAKLIKGHIDEEEQEEDMDLNDDGHVTRSEAKAFRSAKKTKVTKTITKSSTKSSTKKAGRTKRT